METIIGILVVLIPVIFKLIGSKIEKAAAEQQHAAGNAGNISVEDWKGTVLKHLQQLEQVQEDVMPVQEVVCEPVSEEATKAVTEEKQKPKQSPMKRSTPILQEEVKIEREKIDTKKLIVYSEIMKPKYTE